MQILLFVLKTMLYILVLTTLFILAWIAGELIVDLFTLILPI